MEFRLKVNVSSSGGLKTRIHATGDERYELEVDGELAGWGSERGTIDHWYFDSYDLSLDAGEHWLTARVWAAGRHGLRSQMSAGPAFMLAAEAHELSTGHATWEVRMLDGQSYEKPFAHDFFSIGWNSVLDATSHCRSGFTPRSERGNAHESRHKAAPTSNQAAAVRPGSRSTTNSADREEWKPAHSLHPGSTAGRRNRYPNIHLLAPAVLPVTQRETFTGGRVRYISNQLSGAVVAAAHLIGEAAAWNAWWNRAGPMTLPANQTRRVLVDLEDYVCAWTQLEILIGRGARVQIFWAESLYEDGASGRKGDRAVVNGKTFIGVGDTFLPTDGTHTFRSPFIRAGRYIEITVTTGEAALVLEKLILIRAEYPLEIVAEFTTDLAPVQSLLERCQRTVRASCHDNLIDGPYYEQMGWIGDTPQVALTLYSMSRDDRIVRKTLEVFDRSRLTNGMIRARWPARDSLFLPTYSLCWINVLHDFAWWRHDPEFVRARLPGMRAILDGFLTWVSAQDGLLRIPTGWNFVDWVPGWDGGIPPRDADGASGVFQWQLARALGQAAELEEQVGEVELAARFRRHAAQVAQAAEVFWNDARGLYADNRSHTAFSEHTQAYAALSGLIPAAHLTRFKQALIEDKNLTHATDPFTHYVFEAYVRLDLRAHLWPRLQRWFDYDGLGLLTTPEAPEPTRSDCHAWGAHAHFHLFASVLGIRPAAPGFRQVRINPVWDCLQNVSGKMPHPDGEIHFRFSTTEGQRRAELTFPTTIKARLIYLGKEFPANNGRIEWTSDAANKISAT